VKVGDNWGGGVSEPTPHLVVVRGAL